MAIAIGAGVSLGSGIFVEKEFAGTWQTLRNLSQQLASADYVFNNSTSMQDIQSTIESQSDDWNVITVVLGNDASSKFALNNTLSAQSGGINPIVSSAGQFIANQDEGAPGWLSTGEPLSRFTGGGVAGYPQVDGLPWMATAWFDDTSFVGITVHVFDFTITRAADIFASLTAQSIYSLAFGPDGALEVPALSTSWCWSSLSQVGSEGFVTATSRLSAVGGYLAVAGVAGKTLNGNGATNLEINNAANQAYGAGLTIAATESTAELFWNGVSQGTQFMGFCFVPDRSAPSYDSLTLNAPRYNEGDSPVITLNTTNILAGTTVDYSVSPGTEVTPNTGTITITSSGRSTSTFAINTDGTLDTGFNIGTGFNNFVFPTVPQQDGKILVGGLFASYDGVTQNCITRLNTDGTRDTGFTIGTGFNDLVYAIAQQSDGKILVGGEFTSYDGTAQNRITRLNADGTIDSTFATNIGTGFDGIVRAIAIQSDGKILVGGQFTSYGGVTQNYITRLNTDGTRDTGFTIGTGFNDIVRAVALQSDGKILVGGVFTSYDGTTQNRITRLNTDGTRDTGFTIGTGFNSTVVAIALQSDGKILVGGAFTDFDGTTQNRITRLNADGTIDSTFATNIGTGFTSTVVAISLQSDGKIIAGGLFASYNGTAQTRITRLNADGTIDSTFATNIGTGFNAAVLDVAIQPDGRILVGGNFTNFDGTTQNRITRLNADGTRDTDKTFLTVTLNPTDSTGNATGNLTANATINDAAPPGPSFAWDISAAVFVQSYSVAAQETNPLGFFFKPDGTKMYVCGDQGDDVNEYSLSTPWDISGGSVSFVQSQSMVSAGYNFFCGLFFKPDGTKMYSMANAGVNAAVHEWDLSVPWNVSTLVYVQRKLTGSQDSGPSGVFFQDDGLTMYTVGSGNDRVYQYTLSTAWDVSTLTYVQFFSVSAQTGDPRGLWFKPDGTKMYITSADGANDAVHEYDLGTPWDISSAVYLQSLSTGAQDSYATGPVFRSDGQKMYICGLGGDRVYEYDL